MNSILSPKQQVEFILSNRKIYPVYQPIVSLTTGNLLGYEALSRIDFEKCNFNIEELFKLAKEYGYLWNLEYICRKKALNSIKNKLGNKKLFLNVDPDIFRDERFQTGMTKNYLDRYNISTDNIVFEICEHSNIDEIDSFQKAVNHYEEQQYEIAIDDFGKGFSTFNRIFFIHPKFVKLDISLIRNVDTDSVKKSLIDGLVKFCHSENIRIIAEGIETKSELASLIDLGVDFGQGYYLGRPEMNLKNINEETKKFITSKIRNTEISQKHNHFFGNVESICQKLETIPYGAKAVTIFEYMKRHLETTEICVVDSKQNVKGLLTKAHIDECFGGRYGYSLYSKYTVGELLDVDFLEVDCRMPIEMVSRLALIRSKKQLYDAIIVSDNGKYVGIVTVKDLLEASISIQVDRAMDTNPLTHLPGNTQIEQMISNRLFRKEKLSIMYLDLDNFKAYNDAYGFENGDIMIKSVAKCIEKNCRLGEFIGHVGGDDFVVISGNYNLENVFNEIIADFHLCLKELYSENDYINGIIHSQNRKGEPEEFPLASLSGALYTNEKTSVNSMHDFSYKIACAKKASKQHAGDFLKKTETLKF